MHSQDARAIADELAKFEGTWRQFSCEAERPTEFRTRVGDTMRVHERIS